MSYIPFHKPHLPSSTIGQIKKVIDSGWITTGNRTKAFENKFGKTIGSKFNVAVSSCTAALHLAYLAHKVKDGDEIIVPSYTFCSTINTIIHTGATPIFCDIDENTLCLDPKDAEKRITSRTKGIVVIHFAGMPADLDAINEIAKKHNLFVVEDAAHAFMTKYKGSYVGQGNNITCFSFYATKNLTTVEGGMFTCNNENYDNFARLMSLHGISKDAWKRYSKEGSWKYNVEAAGYKYNMTDIEAVIGLEQLKYINNLVKKRKEIAAFYKKYLSSNPNIQLPSDIPYENSQHSWHLFTIRLKESSKVNRDVLIEKLKNDNIGTSVHFIPNHLQPFYKDTLNIKVTLPITEKVYSTILSLPFYEDIIEEEIKQVAESINKYTQ